MAVALVHYPILDRAGAIVTSAITNLDMHDISRSAYTFGATDFFIVHPVEAQRKLAERVQEHWLNGSGGKRIPDRVPPMGILRVVDSLKSALDVLGDGAEVWTTSAKQRSSRYGCEALSYGEARGRLAEPGPPVLLVFGTGWGLAPGVEQQAKVALEPIQSPREDQFNHLSVRAAAAITLWRLCGPA